MLSFYYFTKSRTLATVLPKVLLNLSVSTNLRVLKR